MLFESGAASVYPPSLNERPNGVSCGPKAPTWQVLHGCPVCWAKLGNANALGATATAAKAFAQASAELYPKAKQEGNLIVYSVWDVEHLKVITDAFMKRYPGIKATYWQGRNPETCNLEPRAPIGHRSSNRRGVLRKPAPDA